MGWLRGRAYGQDLRDRVFCSEPARATAERLGVSVSYVVKARARLRETGAAEPGPQCNHVPSRLDGELPALREHVTKTPDATIAELRGWLCAERGIAVGHATVWRAMSKLGLTLKKSRSARPNRIARTLPPPA